MPNLKPIGGTIESQDLNDNFSVLDTQLAQTENYLSDFAVNVRKYGAVGDGVTLDYQAFKDATTIIKANGSGTLILEPNKTYLLLDNTQLEFLFDMEDIKGFNIELNGSTLLFNDTAISGTFDVFRFKNAKHITAKNGVLRGMKTTFPNIVSSPRFFGIYDKTTDVVMENIQGKNIEGFIRCYRSNENIYPTYEEQAKRFKFTNITGELIRYPFSFPFNGSDVIIENVKLDKVHRAYFPYGVKNHKVDMCITNFDSSGCRIQAYDGKGCENIEVSISTDAEIQTTNITETSFVQISYGDNVPAEHKNIKVNFKNIDGKNLVRNGLTFMIYGATNDKHSLTGLEVTGSIKNLQNRAFHLSAFQSATFEMMKMSNINLRNVQIANQGSGSSFLLSNLSGYFNVENLLVTGPNGSFHPRKFGVAEDYAISFVGCIAQNVGFDDFDLKASYISCVIRVGDRHNNTNKTYLNTTINGVSQ